MEIRSAVEAATAAADLLLTYVVRFDFIILFQVSILGIFPKERIIEANRKIAVERIITLRSFNSGNGAPRIAISGVHSRLASSSRNKIVMFTHHDR
jgi:hypothetical protein